MSDELLKRLETGHDKECAMSYGMHEHCCDCSYPARQEAAARVRELEAKYEDEIQRWRNACALMNRAEAERDALRAENERLRAALADICRSYVNEEREWASMRMHQIADAALATK